MLFAAFSASWALIATKSFACPFSIWPVESMSRTFGDRLSNLRELAMVLLAFPVDKATSS
jgi:hypothetical protein